MSYTARRILAMIPILIGVLLITFILSLELPGSPFNPEGTKINPESTKVAEELLGLDKPIYTQLWLYIKRILQGEWGNSISLADGIPVWTYIWQKAPLTIELAVLSQIFAISIGIRAGVFSSVNKNNPKDTIVRFIALLGVSIPIFWLGMVLKYLFALELNLFPTIHGISPYYNIALNKVTGFNTIDSILMGRFDILLDIIWHMILPVFCLAFVGLASITRQTRSSMLEVLELDYIRSARAKGCKEKDVINKHALKNAMIPTITIIGIRIGGLLGGAVLTETTFALDGFGSLMIGAIQNRDYFVINALVLLTTGIFMTANLVSDILYGIMDPRIRY
ncbi:ABC transporter permease [Promethearchaeum syntrophicum]|uniref:ABC transporter permease n=1 Tax=Promethearchaeum syntrophicum TaxID=2594042 RepID=A0A5B9DAW8_9ARCH|nr:ABC transporter permease [Candidatus Prometheoarchaeum syntrophicum]